MEHGPEEHIEHAEHAQHAAHSPFDRRVTVSIAVVAAILAGVSLAGHKAHNDTLLLREDGNLHQQMVGIKHTELADQYAFYQAKNNRDLLYTALLDLTTVLPLKDGSEMLQGEASGKWKKQVEKYKTELPKMLVEAKRIKAEAAAFQKKADQALAASHTAHARADRLDLGALGLQLGVVLCTLAILTRSNNFWYAGLLCSLLGLVIGLSGVFGWYLDNAETEHKTEHVVTA